jgi:Trypsin
LNFAKLIPVTAHCTIYNNRNVTIKVGSLARDGKGVSRSIVEIIQHPKFHLPTFNFDYSLMKMDEPLVFDNSIKPVRLPGSREFVKEGAVCLVSGFGMDDGYNYPNELQATKVMKF